MNRTPERSSFRKCWGSIPHIGCSLTYIFFCLLFVWGRRLVEYTCVQEIRWVKVQLANSSNNLLKHMWGWWLICGRNIWWLGDFWSLVLPYEIFTLSRLKSNQSEVTWSDLAKSIRDDPITGLHPAQLIWLKFVTTHLHSRMVSD